MGVLFEFGYPATQVLNWAFESQEGVPSALPSTHGGRWYSSFPQAPAGWRENRPGSCRYRVGATLELLPCTYPGATLYLLPYTYPILATLELPCTYPGPPATAPGAGTAYTTAKTPPLLADRRQRAS